MGYIYQSMQQFYKQDSDHDAQDHSSIQAVLIIIPSEFIEVVVR